MPEQSEQAHAAVAHFLLSPFQFLFKLSATGEHLAYIRQQGPETLLVIDRYDDDIQRSRTALVSIPDGDTVVDLEWKTAEIIIIVAVNRASSMKKLFAYHLASSLVDLSSGSDECELAALLPAAPEHVLVYDTDKMRKTISLLNISTRERSVFRACPDDEVNYFFDWSGQLRMIFRITALGYQILMPDAATQQFTPICSLPFDGVFIPLFTSADQQDDFYALTNIDREFTSLAKVSYREAFTLVWCETGVEGDVAGITGLDSEGHIEGVIFATARHDPLFFAPGAQQLHTLLKAKTALPLLRIKSVSADKRRYIVAGAGDTVPESSFLYDCTKAQFIALGSSLPDIDVQRLRPMTSLTLNSHDGTVLPCFLTMPKTEQACPLILFPHAGPWTNDSWGFNAIVQCFASAGYAVLQVNFRGSTGYGRSFIRKSIGHWGDNIQHDLTTALQRVMREFPIDNTRIFAFGTSFGGLASLLQLARNETHFAGAATLNAPTDLHALLMDLPALWLPLRQAFYHLIADPYQPDHAARLQQASPLALCEAITAPVLILHSENDQIVDIAQSRALFRALQGLHRDCRFKVLPEEGHDVLARENIAQVVSAVLSFFNSLSAA